MAAPVLTLARLCSRPRRGGLVKSSPGTGVDATSARLLSPSSHDHTYRAVPVHDHSFYGPPMRSLSLWVQSPVSCSTGESPLSLLFHPSKLPITGQGLFRLVRRRSPLGGAGTTPLYGKSTPLWLDTLANVHFSPPTLPACCCLMCHFIFSIQPIPSCIQTFIIRIDDLTNAGEIRAARRQYPPLRGPTISKSRVNSGTSPP